MAGMVERVVKGIESRVVPVSTPVFTDGRWLLLDSSEHMARTITVQAVLVHSWGVRRAQVQMLKQVQELGWWR